MEDKIIESLAYMIPAIVTGGVAYLILGRFIDQENNDKKFNALVEKKRESLPVKLQAYERLLLFCERINPSKLVLRVTPIGADSKSYLHLLINNIEQEFEHNLVQQLYVTKDSWTAVIGSKLAIVNKLRQAADETETAKELRERILKDYTLVESPTETAVAFLKEEVKKLL